jgi:hypothetical protein
MRERVLRLATVNLSLLVVLVQGSPVTAQLLTTPQRISPIPRTQSEPVIAASGDEVVAVWFKRIILDGSGWAYSADGGETWSPEGGFLGGMTNFKIEGQHPVVCADGAGRFYAAVRTSSALGSGMSVYRGSLDPAGFVWQGPVTVGSGTFILEVESPWLACDPAGAYVYLAYTEKDLNRDPPIGGHVITFARSTDGGVTFEPRMALSGEFAGDPRVGVGAGGEVHVLWHDYASGQVVMRTSADHGASFAPEQVVAPMRDNVGLVSTSWASNFARRNPYYSLKTGDVMPNAPAVAVDRSGGARHGTLYAVWTEYAEGTLSATSAAGEVEPNEFYAQAMPVTIGTVVSGVAIDPGKLQVGDHDRFWFEGVAGTTVQIDGELTGIAGPPLDFPFSVPVFIECGEDTTRLQRISNATLTLPGEGPVPPVVFTLPRTGRYWVSTALASIWSWSYQIRIRELTPGAGSISRDQRDVVLVRSSDGGATWSGKVRVNDCPPGDDDTFPEVVVDELGQVHVAWYCKREEVDGCGTETHTYLAVSSDGGETFRPSLRVSANASPWECSGGGPNLGDHLGLAAGGGRVHVAWTEVECPDSVDIYTARVEDVATGVAIGGFAGGWREGGVHLTWQVLEGRGIAEFAVERIEGEGPFAPVGAPIAYRGEGTYGHADAGARAGGTYRYRLVVTRTDGTWYREGPIAVAVPRAPGELAWVGAAPNPFARRVTLELAVAVRGAVRVRVYNVQGQEVARLHEGELDAGTHRLSWDGVNRHGRAVAPGVYLVRAESGGVTRVVRVLQVR